jgi:hypothetical protein
VFSQFPVSPPEILLERVPVDAFALTLLVLGLVLVMLGWQVYRFALFVVGGAFGAGVGGSLIYTAQAFGWERLAGVEPLLVIIPLALLGGVGALLTEKLGAFFAGGACLAALVYIFAPRAQLGQVYWVLLVGGVLAGGILTLLMWKPLIILSLSILGSLFTANGFLLLMAAYSPDLFERLRGEVGPFAVIGVIGMSLGGILFQTRGAEPDASVD